MSHSANKLIAAIGMGAIIVTVVVVFNRRSHSDAAATLQSPPAVAASVASAASPPPADSIPTTPAADVPAPEVVTVGARVPEAKSQHPVVAIPAVAEQKISSAAAITSTGARAAPAHSAGHSSPSAPPAADNFISRATLAPMAAVPSDELVAADLPATSNRDGADSDGQITTAVKSAFAGDGVREDTNISVSTTSGVVTLAGAIGSQEAVERVTDVASKIKDVKRVDASTLIVERP